VKKCQKTAGHGGIFSTHIVDESDAESLLFPNTVFSIAHNIALSCVNSWCLSCSHFLVVIIMRPSLRAALSVAPRLSVRPSVRPSRDTDFLEIGKP